MSAPPTPPHRARRKLDSSVRPAVAARKLKYDKHTITAAHPSEDSLKDRGGAIRTLTAPAARAAKHTPDTAPIIETSHLRAFTSGIVRWPRAHHRGIRTRTSADIISARKHDRHHGEDGFPEFEIEERGVRRHLFDHVRHQTIACSNRLELRCTWKPS